MRFPLSLRNVEDLLFGRGIDTFHESVRLWWNRLGPMFAADIRRQHASRMRGSRQRRWHLDEMFVRVNGERYYLWRPVDHEDEVLDSFVSKKQDKSAAFAFIKKALKRHGMARQKRIFTDGM
jgi:putative transposase